MFGRARGDPEPSASLETRALASLVSLFGTAEKHTKELAESWQMRLREAPTLAVAFVSMLKTRAEVQRILNKLRVSGVFREASQAC